MLSSRLHGCLDSGSSGSKMPGMAGEARIVEDVARLARRLRSLERQVEAARADLYEAVRRAHAAGVSLRTLADLTGLTSSRIHQIVRETRR
jgi:hypothetical protein